MKFVQILFDGVQYDGTNGATLVGALPDFVFDNTNYPPVIHSETGGVLTIYYDGWTFQPPNNDQPLILNEGDWLVTPHSNVQAWSYQSDFVANQCVPLDDLVNE